MKVQHGVSEPELPRDAAGRVICEFCGEVMEPWSPVEGATWYVCECGAAVIGLGE